MQREMASRDKIALLLKVTHIWQQVLSVVVTITRMVVTESNKLLTILKFKKIRQDLTNDCSS